MFGALEEQTFLFGTRFSKPLSGANKTAASDLGVVGGGGQLREIGVRVCRRSLQTLTLIKTQSVNFATLFKTRDLFSRLRRAQEASGTLSNLPVIKSSSHNLRVITRVSSIS